MKLYANKDALKRSTKIFYPTFSTSTNIQFDAMLANPTTANISS